MDRPRPPPLPLPSGPRFLLPPFLAALLAALVWSRGAAPFAWLLFLAPLLGSAAPGWKRFLVALGYSLGCLAVLVPTLAAVLGDAPGRVAGTALLWVFLSAAPWLLARGRTAAGLFGEGLLALGLTALPPLGAIDPFSPAVGATAWAVGLGPWGLAAYALLFSVLLVLAGRPRSPPLWLAAGGLSVGLLVVGGSRLPRPSITTAVGFSGSFGPEPRTLLAQRRRVVLLARLLAHARATDPAARVYVFPEFFLGRFDRGVARWLAPLDRALARRHAEAIAGAAVALTGPSGRTRWTDGAIAFGEDRAIVVTRQPAPLAEWRPWRNRSFPAYWWPWSVPPAGVRLGGFVEPTGRGGRRRIAVAVCYAQTLAWTWLWNTRGGPPAFVAAPESFLWTRARGPRRLEARLARAWGRLFAVPVVVARALPPSA